MYTTAAGTCHGRLRNKFVVYRMFRIFQKPRDYRALTCVAVYPLLH